MGVCHKCRCFYCENLLSRKCSVPRVCSSCYKGLNSRNHQILNCTKYSPYEPIEKPSRTIKPKLGSGKKLWRENAKKT